MYLHTMINNEYRITKQIINNLKFFAFAFISVEKVTPLQS